MFPVTWFVLVPPSLHSSIRGRVRSSVTQGELGEELPFLHIERSQFRWLGYLVQNTSLWRCSRNVPWANVPLGTGPKVDPVHEGETVSQSAWERLGVLAEEMKEMAGEWEVWTSLPRLLAL